MWCPPLEHPPPTLSWEEDEEDKKEEEKAKFTLTLECNIYSAAFDYEGIHGKVILVNDVIIRVVQQVE